MTLQKLKTFSTAFALTALSASVMNAQEAKMSMPASAAATVKAIPLKVPAPSPSVSVKQAFALSDITIEYSRPGVKNRVIFGDVVPFGKVWRTGANGATKITFGENISVEGKEIASGTYAIYTVPNKDSWEVMLYKDLTLGGNVAEYKTENEVMRFKVKPTALKDKVESLTMEVADITATTANVQLDWDKTRISFKVTAEIDKEIMKNIDASIAGEKPAYFQAAGYYYDNNKDLAKANQWIDKAIEENPKAFYMVMLKAKIQLKQNDKKGALESAEKVIPLAKEAKNDDYVIQAEKFIATNKK